MFEQAKLKLDWAQHMLKELDGGLKHFVSEQRCEVRAEHNAETKELRLRIDGDFAPIWPSLILLAGTCAQTVNSSLDYVASEIVNAARGTDRRIVFPMDVDRNQLEASKSLDTLRKIRADLAAHILDEIKPTQMNNFPLWGIRSLANTDKHRNLVFALHNQGFELGWVKTPGVEMMDLRFTAPAGTHNDGCFTIPDVEEYRDAKPIIQISFAEPDLRHPNRFYRLEALEFLSNGLNAAAEAIRSIEQFLTPETGEEAETV